MANICPFRKSAGVESFVVHVMDPSLMKKNLVERANELGAELLTADKTPVRELARPVPAVKSLTDRVHLRDAKSPHRVLEYPGIEPS